ncbi:uncharacterized protein LOC131182130 [Hevea brasiliensis]|uniref:uncharacterized protein LOC131182130 n=1 Tax=Hevea brasiliensis TaxID=3981 RepID=UPI0025F4B105|nr:uncharacterized protein LOC131182130 [Hevea brasiliensis]
MVHELRALLANLEIDDEGQMIATWQVKPLLTDQIKMTALNDEKYVKLMEEAQDGKKHGFSVNDDGLLLHQGRVFIPNDVELRTVKEHYWWMGMKKDIAEYVAKYLTCQQIKAKHQVPAGLL